MNQVEMDKLEYGKVSEMAGEAAFQYVKKVTDLALAENIDSTVTNALKYGSIFIDNHVEYYQNKNWIKGFC